MKPSFPLLSAIAFLLLTACSPNRQKVEEAQQNIEQALKEISLIEDRILEAGNRSDSLRLIEFNSEEERQAALTSAEEELAGEHSTLEVAQQRLEAARQKYRDLTGRDYQP